MAKNAGEDPLVAAWMGIGFGAMAAFASLAFVTARIGPASIPIWAIAIWGGMMVFRGPLGKALAARISGQPVDGQPVLPEEVYGELDELRTRVAELEERVDFSERLLTKGKTEA